MVKGITSANLGFPDYSLGLDQHVAYAEALKRCGLNVTLLKSEDLFPDSVFIEDVALCTPHCAIVTRPGADSRSGEVAGMEEVLGKFYHDIEKIEPPGTVEAGDIMMVENHYYIGLSSRTNAHGAEQMIRILNKYGMTGSTVPLVDILHLKTGLSYLENNQLLVCGSLSDYPDFRNYEKIRVDADEAYAANSLWINGTVLVPSGFPKTLSAIEQAGHPVITLDMSEFRKLDGGLSCLSLRF